MATKHVRPVEEHGWPQSHRSTSYEEKSVIVCCDSYNVVSLGCPVEARALNQQILILLMNVSAETTTSAFLGRRHLQKSPKPITEMNNSK